MNINWEVIAWTCITLAVIMGIFALILGFISAKNMRARREQMREIHTGLAIGSQVMFAGGLYGRVVGIEEDTLNVEIAKGTVIKIDRYAVQGISQGK
ncbi:MAG: preprotein translocase subunit YajC [Lachnospiraceae bacterium]|nr:preprotein translocase subunit YajC [Lachnospiraceae bacterium]